jgi:hypothetical protein
VPELVGFCGRAPLIYVWRWRPVLPPVSPLFLRGQPVSARQCVVSAAVIRLTLRLLTFVRGPDSRFSSSIRGLHSRPASQSSRY